MIRTGLLTFLGIWLMLTATPAAQQLKALIIDGRNNHDWQATTPVLRKILEDTGLFKVDVARSSPSGEDLSGFSPQFDAYDVLISNYNDLAFVEGQMVVGPLWSQDTRKAFEGYVRSGGGFISFHSADNAFPEWEEYNTMIALGGWGGRDEKSGPFVYYQDGRFVLDNSPGKGGGHGQQHAFEVVIRDDQHPVTKGLPERWMHVKDELYHQLRGPVENVTWLATAYSNPETGGTGRHEPVLFAISYGQGRVFHTTLGHSPESMTSTGFIVTLQRAAEWAATGKVTQKIPPEFK
ncbi:MAG: ThuA domain-containing protein [Acidobacteriota bacterium]